MIASINRVATLLAVLVLAGWSVAAKSQEPESSQEAEPEEAESVSIYDTLIFDIPVALSVDENESVPSGEADPGSMGIDPLPALEYASDRSADIQRYQDSIASIEFEGGTWDLTLAETLITMAETYEEQGAYREAIDAYDRAMHISRINLGLNSLEHIPIVERIIVNHLALGNWAEADQYQEYLYYTEHKTYGADDPRMVPVLDRMARWNLSVFNAGWGDLVGLRLAKALYQFQRASALVSTYFGEQDSRYVRFLRNSADAAYLISRNQRLIEDVDPPDFRDAQIRYSERTSGFRPDFQQGYSDGLEALQQIVRLYENDEEKQREHALALIHEGDWYLLFDRSRGAQEKYQKAYEILAKQENGEQSVREIFGTVTPLPNYSDEIDTIFIKNTIEQRSRDARKIGYVDVAFDLSASGSVSNLQILSDDAEVDDRVLSSLRRRVRSTVFRPIVENGEVVRSENNQLRYRYLY